MTKERGSEKLLAQLFGGQDASPEALSRAVGEVRAAGFIIDSWWWRGQPRIEAISAKLRVDRNSLGAMAEQLAGLHSAEQQVSLEVFPYGLPRAELFHVGVEVNRNLQKIPG